MKRSRFSEEQIIGILKEHEAGVAVPDLCPKSRGHGRLPRLRALETRTTRLKRLLADYMLDNAALKDLLSKAEGDRFGRRRLHVLLKRKVYMANHQKLFRL